MICAVYKYTFIHSVDLFILGESMNFFRHLTVKKTRLSLPADRLICLYIHWCPYMIEYVKSVCGKNVSTTKFPAYYGKIKSSETVLRLILFKVSGVLNYVLTKKTYKRLRE